MEKDLIKVTFKPDNVDILVKRGANLLETALDAGVHIAASCGGEGTCGTCRVKIESGETESKRTNQVSPKEYDSGVRQACITKLLSASTIYVLPESRIEAKIVKNETSSNTYDSAMIASDWGYKPPIRKVLLKMKPPTLSDNTSDLERFKRALKKECGIKNPLIDFSVTKILAETLREGNWVITVTIFDVASCHRVVSIEPGDTRSRLYALAIDIGTTAVDMQLLDLCKGTVISEALSYNAQIKYGADVITRIAYSQKTGGLEKLQKAVNGTINEMISGLLKDSGVSPSEVSGVFVAANTIMTHLFFGLNPKYLRLDPYVPVTNSYPFASTSTLDIKLNTHAVIYALPSVASYIGGDIVAGVIGSGMHQSEKLTLYIDIGTNGEIAIGNNDWIATASCSAGPAFEGGGIRHGIIACGGAIDGVKISPSDFEPSISTIGGDKPKGICGAGLIELVSEMLNAGIIDRKGTINKQIKTKRIRKSENDFEYILCNKDETQTGKDITISEADIDNLIRAKGAVYAGCQTLAQSVGIELRDVERIIIAGTFGNKINIEHAISIGLLPDVERDKFAFIGNGSLLGARLSAFSADIVAQSETLARHMTNIELSNNNNFMNNFIAALFLPHTDIKRFPSAERKLLKAK